MKFEYRVTGIIAQEELNRLGQEGWELVTEGRRSVLKRPVPEPSSDVQVALDFPAADPGRRDPGESVRAVPGRKPGNREKVNT